MEIEAYVNNLITDFFKHIQVSPKHNVRHEGDKVLVDIQGDDLSFLIGFRGTSLDAFDHFLRSSVYKKHNVWLDLELDINDYKRRKIEKLEDMVKSFIDKVRFFQKPIELHPMSPSDRRIIHEFIGTYDDVITESVGEGPHRRIVIKLATDDSN